MAWRGARQQKKGGGAGGIAAAGVLLAVVLTLLPLALCAGSPLSIQRGEEPSAEARSVPAPSAEATPTGGARDRGRTVRLLQKDGAVAELTMADYLWGVVAAEMPASFEEEALKAQTCAARTYAVTKAAEGKHEGADLCADSTCCQAYVDRALAEARWGLNAGEYAAKIERAVADTDGLGVLYQGAPIQALFFSSAAGRTVDAAEVWGNSIDYLKGVTSPEGAEVPNYQSQVVLTAAQVKETVLAAYPGADLTGAPSGWFGRSTPNSAGGVASILLGGVTLTGAQVRGLFALRSANFTVSWDGENFTFDVTGYGHGVGMSQYGANAMAKSGSAFRDILTWYYTGAQVDYLWP